MPAFEWRPVRMPDPERFAGARLQFHSALQWLARISSSYVEANDAGDLALRWRADRTAVTTSPWASDLELELRLPDLILQFTERGAPSLHALDVEERSPAHVEAWILIELLHRGIDREKFSKALPYDVSDLLQGDAVEFSPDEYEPELEQLSAWIHNAAGLLEHVGRTEDADEPAQRLRIWPQGLRFEVRIPARNGNADSGSPSVLGFAPGDAKIAEPFFYVTRGVTKKAGPSRPDAVLKASEIPLEAAGSSVARFLTEGALRS